MATPSSSSKQQDPTTPKASKAGIITDADGNSHIPSSVRADGSVRKEIRIRPGYRPPEDVEVYRNRTAEAWRNRGTGTGVIPGAESIKSKDEKDGDSKGKNAKRREARKKAAAAKAADEDKPNEVDKKGNEKESEPEPKAADTAPTEDQEAEKQKEAKKLLKKLRQARELKDKKEQGGALLPEQFEKVIRINELIRQLDGLGFDANGEKKTEKEDT